MKHRWRAALLLGAVAIGSPAAAQPFRLPLADYPLDDGCLGWGGLNPHFERCGVAGVHVADDACAPNDTPVLAVADGRVRLAQVVGDCFDNWGWIVVVEHGLADGGKVCSIYGHCAPARGISAGTDVKLGQHIALIDNICLPHIHFGIYAGAFAAADGDYPEWLFGYLPNGRACASHPTPWPGRWVDPVQFVRERVDVAGAAWTLVKVIYR